MCAMKPHGWCRNSCLLASSYIHCGLHFCLVKLSLTTASSQRRVHLSLDTKVKVTNQAKSNSQLPVRSLELCIPHVMTKVKRNVPWMNSSIVKAIKHRNRLFRIAKRTDRPIDRIKYNVKRHQIVSLLRNSKQESFDTLEYDCSITNARLFYCCSTMEKQLNLPRAKPLF